MTERQNQTVTYHRAEYDADKHPYEWWVQFTEDARSATSFTAAEGEVMGLTPPEPAPLVVTCNGHSIELSAAQERALVDGFPDDACNSAVNSAVHLLQALVQAGRMDPQPDSEPWPWGDEGYMCPKMVRETMCVAQAAVGRSPGVDARRVEHVERISRLINLCDRHRPLGPDGKHGTRQCTPTCGCEDKRDPITPVRPAPVSPAEGLRAVLAGRTDADELIEYAKQFSYPHSDSVDDRLMTAIGDAARSGGAK